VNTISSIDLFIPDIKTLLQKKDFKELKKLLLEINPIDLAEGLSRFTPDQQILILKLLPPHRMMAVFEELDLKQQQFLFDHLGDEALAPLLEDIPPDMAAKLFKKFPEQIVKRMSNLMKKEKIDTVCSILNYPPQTVGAVMQSDVLTLSPNMTAKSALERLQAWARTRIAEHITMLYVTNSERKLLGGVPLQSLIGAPTVMKIRDIMSPVSLIKITVSMDREEAAKIFVRYHLNSAPVVDDENRLVGVLNVDDIIQIIEKESTEDIQKLAAVEALDEPYFKISFLKMVKKRATWLCVLFLGEMLTATAMGFFEYQIAKAVVLALFIPLIISSGGNSGSQAATLVVRAMALKEIAFGDWWRVVWRELAAGFTLGSILGTIGFSKVWIWSQFSDTYGPQYTMIAVTVGVTLILIVMWGTLIGSVLPIFLKRLGLDPAVASAPFVATLVDVTGLVIYFTVALLTLSGTLL